MHALPSFVCVPYVPLCFVAFYSHLHFSLTLPPIHQAQQTYHNQELTSYNPHKVAYVEFSSKYGLSERTKEIKVIADNKLNLPPQNQDLESQKKWRCVVTMAAVLTAVIIHNRSHNGSTTISRCQDGFILGMEIDIEKRTCVSNEEAVALGKTKYKSVRAVFSHPIIHPQHSAYSTIRDGDNNDLA